MQANHPSTTIMIFMKVVNVWASQYTLTLSATLIEVPHPHEVNYLAGKEASSSVLINYLWRYNYSEYGTLYV